jgi:phosphatidylglycerophosphate synthase
MVERPIRDRPFTRRSPVTARPDAPVAASSQRRFSLEDIRATYKWRDAWWTVYLVDPLASRLMLPLVNHTRITPNQVSSLSFVVGIFAALSFVQGGHGWLVLGAALYHISFVLDCIDGKIARLKGTGSVFGMWLDYSFDRYRVMICAVGLSYGQYVRSDGELRYVWLAVAIIFLDMLRYMDALQLYKLRRTMRGRLRKATRRIADAHEARPQAEPAYVAATAAIADDLTVPDGLPVDDTVTSRIDGEFDDQAEVEVEAFSDGELAREPRETSALGEPALPDLQADFRQRFQWWLAFRETLRKQRVRPHLFSGVEFQMFVFIVGPLLDLVIPVVVLAAALLLVFEFAIVYKFHLSTRDFDRAMAPLLRQEEELERAVIAESELPRI